MRVITTHINTDFDGMASMAAASKLYPGSFLVFPGRMNDNVKEFVSLYKDYFNLKKLSQVNPGDIQELIVVDTQQASRLGPLAQHLGRIPRIIIYDHHDIPREDAIIGAEKFIDVTGATVTILLEIMMRGDLDISPLEATIYALGLYEDTGCFTYPSTSVREIGALKHLAEKGLDFRIIKKFIVKPLTEKQKYLLELLLNSIDIYQFKGIKVAISTGETQEDIRGLSFVTSRLMELEDVDLIIAMVRMGGRVHLVGRSSSDRINLKELLKEYNGGGHESAASAVLSHQDLAGLKNGILKKIHQTLLPAVTAKDIMSYPVRSISPRDTIEEAWYMLVKYGHSGFPVTDKGKMLGVISRRDLEKAKHHGLTHAPVKAFMSRKVETVRPDTSLQDIEYLMIDKGVGRLPVNDDRGRTLGIVTRSDVLKVRHRKNKKGAESRGGQEKGLESREDMVGLLNRRLPKKIQGLLFLVGQKADLLGCQVYTVGGFVRDLLLGEEDYDIDLVVEPDAIAYARELNKFLEGRLTVYEQFGTAKIVMRDGLRLDLASARQEFYAQPGALPQVEMSNIKQDLYRRDFTINTLALQLNIDKFGKLLNYFNGLEDLRHRLIRILYNLSFVEDPLRILRAVRFEQRLGFQIEEDTLGFLINAVEARVISRVPRERLLEEINLAFSEKNPVKVLRRLQDFNLLPRLFPRVRINDKVFELLEEAHQVTVYFQEELKVAGIKKAIPYLCALFYQLPGEELSSSLYQMKLGREVRRAVQGTLDNHPRLVRELNIPGVKPSQVYGLLQDLPIESLIFLSASSDKMRVWGYIKEYMDNLSRVVPLVTGEDLKELGYKPGPLFKEVLLELKKARLDGRVKTRQDEIQLVIEYMGEREGVRP